MKLVIVLAALLLAPLAPMSFAAGATPPGCAAGPVADAARALVHPGASVERLDVVAGFDSALVLAPLVYPGVPHRLVEARGLWCGVEGLNAAWRLDGRAADPEALASAFAQLAGAPWMRDVDVTSASLAAPGVVALSTHAPLNGIVAEWRVVVGPRGVAGASLLSKELGVRAERFEWEGLVAMPGFAREWRLGASGALEATEPLLREPPTPAVTIYDRMSDGFRIKYDLGGVVGLCPDPGVETGVQPVDVCSLTRRLVRENYEEFLSWGLQKGWSRAMGVVYIDDSTAASCFACVYISQEFQIHIHTAILPYLRASGYAYEDDAAAYSNVLGHEMFHNFQSAYYKPGDAYMAGAYTEGLARFQETLHEYSAASHQPESLVYADDANGCNDEIDSTTSRPFEFPEQSPVQWAGGGATLASGPATSQSYSACGFWMSWYGQHGLAGLQGLLLASRDQKQKEGWDEVKGTIEQATGAPVDGDLAAYARSLLTGDGLAWGPAAGEGDAIDWGVYLQRWQAPTLQPGGAWTLTLEDGGMMAARLRVDGVVSVEGEGVRLYLVRDDGALSTVAEAPSGQAVAVGSDAVWAVAVLPGVGETEAALSFA